MSEDCSSRPVVRARAVCNRREAARTALAAFGAAIAAKGLSACGGVARDAAPLEPAETPPTPPAVSPQPRSSEAGSASTRETDGPPSPTLSPSAPATGTVSSDAGAARVPLRAACPNPTIFAAFVDDAPRASFRQTAQSTTLDWLTIGIAMALHLSGLPERILMLLRKLGELRLGYPLSMLDHSLQAATRARRANASDDLVLAALCHRLGMVLSLEGYAELSASVVRGYVSDDAYRIVRHHAEYAPVNGDDAGATVSAARARYATRPWHRDAVRFTDAWCVPSFDRGYDTLPLLAFEPLVRDRFAVGLNDAYKTRNDCIEQAAQP